MTATAIDLQHAKWRWKEEAGLDAQCDCDCDCASALGYAMQGNLAGVMPVPVIYSLELTFACNNKCPGCGNVFEHKGTTDLRDPPLSLDRWQEVLDRIAPYAARLKLTGGEPTLHPQFEQIVQAVWQRGLGFTLFTNARWPEPERLITLLRDAPPRAGLLISLHGADATAHEAFTGVSGSFAETVANIRRATEAGLTVHTNAVLNRHNNHQLEALVKLSRSLGAACAVFNRYIGRPQPDLELSRPALKRAVQGVEQLGRAGHNVKFGTCIPPCFVESSSTGCSAGNALCTIDPWGNVRPCNHAPQIAGNILVDPLETIWRSPVMQAWRELVPIECKDCGAFAVCHGGCRAAGILQGCEHDLLMMTPLPRINQELCCIARG